jgi:DNA-binding transcriptional ArsR family regulator
MQQILLIFKALSDRNRLRIFAALTRHDELCACQIIELLQVTGATASRHLSLLVNAGLLQSRKEGRWIFYRLKKSSFNTEVTDRWLKDVLVGTDDIVNDLQTMNRIIGTDREELCRKQRGEMCCPVNR